MARAMQGRLPPHSFLKFSAVGVLNTMIDFGLFAGLVYGTGMAVLPAHAAAFLCATVNSFFWNRRWVFRSRGGRFKNALTQYLVFLLYTVMVLAVTAAALYALAMYIPVMMAKTIVVGITMLANYLGYRVLIFRG